MKQTKSIASTVTWVNIYAFAMGFLEAAVVIYLRELYYPDGFTFPLQEMPIDLVKVEVLREAATIIMLIAIAMLASKNKWQRWGYFLMSFAVWDIIYYVGLKWFYNWPESLFTWDVLFLIPNTWVGPVITPIIIAVLMIVLSYYLILGNESNRSLPLIGVEIWSLIFGGVICIISFTLDYTQQLIKKEGAISMDSIFRLSESYVPQAFNWVIYGLGIGLMLYGIAHYQVHFYKMIKRNGTS